MATRALASAVFDFPIDVVWNHLRDFTFNAKLISTIQSSEILDGRSADSVGAVRKSTWTTGETQQHRLIELSDQNYRLAYELVAAEPAAENLATITTIRFVFLLSYFVEFILTVFYFIINF